MNNYNYDKFKKESGAEGVSKEVLHKGMISITYKVDHHL
jgi:hypothetical protein